VLEARWLRRGNAFGSADGEALRHEEQVVAVLLQLGALIEDLAVLDGERMKRELLAQTIEPFFFPVQVHPAQRRRVGQTDVFDILPHGERAVGPQVDNAKHRDNNGEQPTAASIGMQRCMRQSGGMAAHAMTAPAFRIAKLAQIPAPAAVPTWRSDGPHGLEPAGALA
jgi:hypothetical protein